MMDGLKKSFSLFSPSSLCYMKYRVHQQSCLDPDPVHTVLADFYPVLDTALLQLAVITLSYI